MLKGFEMRLLPESMDETEEVDYIRENLLPADFLVLDGYHFNADYQARLKPHVCKLICIDDVAPIHFHADMIINHSNPEMAAAYSKEPGCRILAGPRYLMLRKHFRKAAKNAAREITKAETVFVCMGGADPFNVTNKILEVLLEIDFIKNINIINGQAYRLQAELANLVASANQKNVQVETGVDAQRLVELIESSHFAICTASSVAFEVASVKCGLITGMVADNQEMVHKMLTGSYCALDAGDLTEIKAGHLKDVIERMNNAELINTQMKNQSALIDGNSDTRLVEAFNNLEKC